VAEEFASNNPWEWLLVQQGDPLLHFGGGSWPTSSLPFGLARAAASWSDDIKLADDFQRRTSSDQLAEYQLPPPSCK
jgi:hypothetical protein